MALRKPVLCLFHPKSGRGEPQPWPPFPALWGPCPPLLPWGALSTVPTLEEMGEGGQQAMWEQSVGEARRSVGEEMFDGEGCWGENCGRRGEC